MKNLLRFHLYAIVLSVTLYAKRDNIRFQHLTVDEGLSVGVISSILQDSEGFMWFGTEDGLNKYDGKKITIFRHILGDSSSLVGNLVHSIFEDKQGKIWIGTTQGLSCYDRESNRFHSYIHMKNDPTSLSDNHVLEVYEDSRGTLWIGTFKAGLNKFNRKNKTFTSYTKGNGDISLSNNTINSIFEDSQGQLWIGTANGLNQMNLETGELRQYKKEPKNASSLSNNCINSVAEDESGDIWIGTCGGGVNRLNKKKNKFTHFLHNPKDPESLGGNSVTVIFKDSRGIIWLAIEGQGLNRFDPTTKKFIRYLHDPNDRFSISSKITLSIYEDRAGIIWFGNYGNGLDKLNLRNRAFKLYSNDMGLPGKSLDLNHNRAFYEDDDGIIWVGSDGGGLIKMDRRKDIFTSYRHDPLDKKSISSDRVYSIVEDDNNMLWVGTFGGGLNKFNRKTETFTHYKHHSKISTSLSSDKVRKLYIDRSGTLWIGTYGGGLNKFNREKNNFVRYLPNPDVPGSISHEIVFSITEDHEDKLWIGTFGGGLNQYDRKNDTFIHYRTDEKDSNTISQDRIITINESKTGELWIATHGEGLNKFIPEQNKFVRYNKVLPIGVIYSILEDNAGFVWLSGNRGITKFNPNTGHSINYQQGDGLQGNEFNGGAHYKSRQGEMFFGGPNGFNAFFPEQIKTNETVPNIKITDFQLFFKSVPVGPMANGRVILKKNIAQTREVILRHDENILAFEFVSLDYAAPELNQYAFYMEGLDKNWIDLGTRNFIAFSGLKPGKYVFRVKGSNNNEVWNNEGTALSIIIQPPVWETWWFRLLMGTALLTIILGTYKGSTMVLRQKLERERLGKELKLKSEFTAMLVHDLRNPLQSLMGYAEILVVKNIDPYVTKAGNIINSTSHKLIELINDMLDVYKFEADKMRINKEEIVLKDIFKEIEDLNQPVLIKKNLKIKKSIEVEKPIKADYVKLGRVMNNLLSNAIKFAPEKSVIKVKIKLILNEKNTFQEFSVEDEGPGVEPEKQKYLFNPYSQLENKQGNLPKGTGLGLAVTKLTIDAHNGEIGYRTGQSGGSVFYFRLPESGG